MRPLPFIFALSLLLAGCGRMPDADDEESRERMQEEQQARQLSEMHEREAAIDERVLAQREQTATPQPIPVFPPPAQAAAPTPAATPAPAPATPPSPKPAVSYQDFYDALAGYGAWIQLSGYGYVWQPAATAHDPLWRPYTLGHWAFTDDGWTWVSDEPFGWITYHYGRWMRTQNLGWVWTPGDQWAPAWVSWRYGNGYAGWAPLPPEARLDAASTGIQQWADQQYNLGPSDYTFVPESEFGDEDMAQEAVPPAETGPIFDESNNCTNIYYDTATLVIYCYGPSYDFMRSKSRRPLAPPYALRRFGYLPGGRNEAIVSGSTLGFPGPRIVRGPATAAPKESRGGGRDTRYIAPRNVQPPPANTAGGGLHSAPAGSQAPERTNPRPVSPAAETQTARDLELIQRQRAEDETNRARREAEANRAAAQQQSEVAAARAQAAANAARQQAAQGARQAQAVHAGLPAGSPMPGRAGP